VGFDKSPDFDPWMDLEYEDHEYVQKVIKQNPDGMTFEQIGKVMGITRERARQIGAEAVNKLKSGEGLYKTVDIDGCTLALVECEWCGEYFPRNGRSTMCGNCEELVEDDIMGLFEREVFGF
jgi:hypothetical protein